MICDLHLNLVFALKCSFVYFTFVFDMHSAQIKTFTCKESFTDKEITFFFRLNNGCKGSCGVLDSVSSCFIYKAR